MQKNIMYTMLILTFIVGFAVGALAEMGSENYRIPTSVMSGGGMPMESASYQTNSTVGQPSPLMDPADPPYSTSYDLYPGFWYTVAAEPTDACESDFDQDGDVDGSDLAVFAAGGATITLEEFASDFGGTNRPVYE